MAEPVAATRHWCHICAQVVNPVVVEAEAEIRCPRCNCGFVEEVASYAAAAAAAAAELAEDTPRSGLSIWVPIALGVIQGPRRRAGEGEDPEEEEQRRRRGYGMVQFLSTLRGRDQRRREGVVDDRDLFFNNRLLVQVPAGDGAGGVQAIPLVDYFLGPDMQLFLQHLAGGDPGILGSRPALKAAVEAMPIVEVVTSDEAVRCPVCLEEFAVGDKALEMPCKHLFHALCILQWLDMHSSCPVCRFLLPTAAADNSNESSSSSAAAAAGGGNGDGNGNGTAIITYGGGEGQGQGENGEGLYEGATTWPFGGLFHDPSASTSTSASASGPSGSSSQAGLN